MSSLLLVCCLVLAYFCASEADPGLLRECLGGEEATSSTNSVYLKKSSSKSSRRPFFLSYGESGIEYFNVLRSYELDRIRKLALCVQQSAPSSNDRQHDGGNSTSVVITGLLQMLLPTETKKIVKAIRQALEDADWADKAPYGIRHAYVWTQAGPPLSERPPREENPDVFVVAPRRAREEAAERQKQEMLERRLQREAELRANMFRDSDSAYLAVLPLVPRSRYMGGQVLIEHPAVPIDAQKRQEAERWEDEDEDGSSAGGVFALRKEGLETHTPEAGSLLLVPMAQRVLRSLHASPRGEEALLVGLEPVRFGEARLLVLELWPFADAPRSDGGKADRELGLRLGAAQPEVAGVREAAEL
eukprot:gene34977-42356_t